ENNASACQTLTSWRFQPSGSSGNFDIFAIQPVYAATAPSSFSGTSNPGYAINTHRGSFSTYHVWRVRNVTTASSGTLSQVTLSNHSYSIPPAGKQPGTSTTIDSGDDRVLD